MVRKESYTVTFELSSAEHVARLQALAAELGIYPSRGPGKRLKIGSASGLLDALASAVEENLNEVATALRPMIERIRGRSNEE